MQLSATSQYAIRILVYMADQKDSQPISAAEMAKILFIPYKFLAKIMTALAKAGLVVSTRGKEGGYRLKKKTSDIMVGDILDAFHDSIKDEQCILGIGFCNGVCKCALHDQWMEPKLLLQKMFRESSLEDIAGRGCKR